MPVNIASRSLAGRACYKHGIPPTIIGSEHVWISDDHVAHLFQRYIYKAQQHRNVSLVPGPLEARKRASRRRLGVLTPVGGLDLFDLSLFQDNGKTRLPHEKRSKWQWQEIFQPMTQREITERREEPVELPIWLREPRSILEQYINDESQDNVERTTQVANPDATLAGNEWTTIHQMDSRRVAKYILDKVGGRNTVPDIKSWCNRYRLNPGTDVELSRALFRALVDSRYSLSCQLQFLEHNGLNHIEAPNFNLVLGHNLLRPTEPLKEPTQLLAWITERISSGLMTEEHIGASIAALCRHASQPDTYLQKNQVLNKLLDGLRYSSSLRGRDLSPRVLEYLLRAIACRPGDSQSFDLGVGIIRTFQKHHLVDVLSTLRNFFRAWMASCCHATGSGNHETVEKSIKHLTTQLIELSSSVSHHLLSDLNTMLLAKVDSESANIHRVNLVRYWWTLLCSEDRSRPTIFEIIASKLFATDLTKTPSLLQITFLEILDDTAKCQFLLDHVYGPRQQPICKPSVADDGDNVSVANEEPQKPYEARIESHLPDPSPFIDLIRILQRKPDYPGTCQRHLIQTMRGLGYKETIIFIVRLGARFDCLLDFDLIADEINATYQEDILYAFKLLSFCQPLRLTSVPDMAIAVIENPDLMHHGVLTRIKKQIRSATPTATESGVERMIRPKLSFTQGPSLHLDRIQLWELLGRMAVAYSKAEHIHPTMALKAITELVQLTGSIQLPTRPCVSRALVRVGVVRPLGQNAWVSKDRIAYIMKYVNKIEGPEVAKRIYRTIAAWQKEVIDNARSAVKECDLGGVEVDEATLQMAERYQLPEVWDSYEEASSLGPSTNLGPRINLRPRTTLYREIG